MQAAVRVAFGLLAAVAFPVCARAQTAAPRLALVIAEASYPQAPPATAAADAGLMATAFAQAGFEVTAFLDADAGRLRQAITDFAAKARAAGPGVALAVYVTGDGLQYAGENRLVPAAARIERDDEIPGATLRLAELTGPLQAVPAATRLFLFDLARETPFARTDPPLADGLALVDAPVGSVYAFATAPGAVAPPDVPPYGAYARAFAEAMQEPGLPLGEVLRRVRLRVGERTDGAAVPFDDGAADSGFAFFLGSNPAPTPVTAPPPAMVNLAPAEAYSTAVARDTLPAYVEFLAAFPHDPLAGRVRTMAAARREALIWQEALRANTPRAYWTYMRRYPRGPHFGDVRRQLFALRATLEPPPRFDIVAFEGLPPPPPDEVAALEHPFLTFADADGPSIPAPPSTLLPPPRSGFFETLPPSPIALAGALAPPLPVATPGESSRPRGAVAQPAAPGGALITTLDSGTLTTMKTGGTVVSRLFATVVRGVRTIREVSGTGASIGKVTLSTGGDGTLTMVEAGPSDVVLSRSVNREALGGGRATTLFDAAGRPLATSLVSPAGIVTASAMVPGRTAAPRFVLAVEPDAKGLPMVVAEVEDKPHAFAPSATAPSINTKDRGRQEAKDAKAVSPSSAVEAGAAKAPAMPAAAGLTGQAPSLNIPPSPPTPAFDAAAAPVAPPPAAAPTPQVAVAVAPPAAAPLPAASTPHQAATPVPVVTPPPSTAQPASAAAPETAEAAHLPSAPPLPPMRPAEPRGRHHVGR